MGAAAPPQSRGMTLEARRFRYRALSAGSVRDVQPHGRGVSRLVAEAGAVHDVNANELEASHAELVAMLRDGEVSASDLVLSEGRWVTFETSPEFFDVCEDVVDPRKAAHSTRSILYGVAAIAVVLIVAFLRLMR
jgi:hypothetical protein